MRVNPYSQNNRTRQPMPNQFRPQDNEHEMPAMSLAKKIKGEQGSLYAGYFLNAVRPYVPPAEIIMIERTLDIHAEVDPRFAQPQQQNPENHQKNTKNDMQLLQLFMSLMGNNAGNSEGGSKIDPMALFKLMNK